MSDVINIKTGKNFGEESSQTRLQAMMDTGVAPAICLETTTKAYTNLTKKLKQNQALFSIGTGALQGSANATVGGMMRNVGARNAAMFGGKKNPYQTYDNALVSMFDGKINADNYKYVDGETKAFDVITNEYHLMSLGESFEYRNKEIINNCCYTDISSETNTFIAVKSAFESDEFSVMGFYQPTVSSMSSGVYFPYISNPIQTCSLQLNNVNNNGNVYLNGQEKTIRGLLPIGTNKIIYYFCVDGLTALLKTYDESGTYLFQYSDIFSQSSRVINSIRMFNRRGIVGYVESQRMKLFTQRYYKRTLSDDEVSRFISIDVKRFTT